MLTPVTSLGKRSGVNWMRLKVQPIERASDFASTVLPTPGTSSISKWPWQTSAMRASSTSWRFPTMTFSTLRSTASSMPSARAMPALPSAALLVLASAAAGARIVAPHLAARAHRPPAARLVAVGHQLLLRARLLLADDRDVVDQVRHIVLDVRQ